MKDLKPKYTNAYLYLVERKSDGRKFVLIGNLNNPNIGSYKYLYPFVSIGYKYAMKTPYGLISNVTCDGIKYDAKYFRTVHNTKINSINDWCKENRYYDEKFPWIVSKIGYQLNTEEINRYI